MLGKYQQLAGRHVLIIGGTSGIEYAVAEASFESGAGERRSYCFYSGGSVDQHGIQRCDAGGNAKDGSWDIFAPLLVAKIGRNYLEEGPNASITLTTGVMSDKPTKGLAVLASFAARLHGMVRGLAVDLVSVRVNVVSPGAARMEFWDCFGEDDKERLFEMGGIGFDETCGRAGGGGRGVFVVDEG